MNASIVILEEAAYVSQECFFEVICPLLQLRNVAFIGITTINGKVDNYINDLIRRNIFDHYLIATLCNACKLAGNFDCEHKKAEIPKWQSAERRDFVKAIYGNTRDDQLAREAHGILKTPKNTCFDSDAIFKLFSKERMTLTKSVEYLFVTIDPCGGSMSPEQNLSDFAVCAHVAPGLRIIGLEAIPIQVPDDYETRLIQFIIDCMKHPMIRQAQLVVIVEGNLALEASHIRRIIHKQFPSALFIGDMGNKDGVKTDEKSKHQMALIFDTHLRSGAISISDDFVTTDPEPTKLLEKAKTQLLNYSRLTVPAKSPFNPTRFKYSGKGKNLKDKDDLSIVLQLALYWSQRFFTSTEFLQYHR